jgi:holin-like protein
MRAVPVNHSVFCHSNCASCWKWDCQFFNLPFSGSIIGMVLLLVVLGTGLVKIKWVSAAADLHLNHMTLLFIPLIVGIFFKLKMLQGQSWKLIVVLIISSLLGLLGTGYTAELYEKLKKGEDEC